MVAQAGKYPRVSSQPQGDKLLNLQRYLNYTDHLSRDILIVSGEPLKEVSWELPDASWLHTWPAAHLRTRKHSEQLVAGLVNTLFEVVLGLSIILIITHISSWHSL